jgi:hypothetical protein
MGKADMRSVKILFAAAVALGLTSLSLWGYQLVSGISDSPWPFLLHSPFKVSAALILLLLFSGVIVYDVVSIFLFRFGFERVNGEIAFYAGPEGAVGRKLSTREKLTILYPAFLFSIQFVIAMMYKHSVHS